MKKAFLILLLVANFLLIGRVFAEENARQLDYGSQPVVDMDLDGLTDLGERRIFNTDPNNADSDADGFDDGAEVLGSVAANAQQVEIAPVKDAAETPWAWYVSRMSALVAFLLLYSSILLGVSIRIPFMRKIFAPAYSIKAHCWISLQAVIFAFIHGGALMFDKFLGFGPGDVFVPLAASYEPTLVALGVISLYLMVILTATSYLKKYISHKIWRITHTFNILIYVFSVAHAFRLGTDLKAGLLQDIFIALNELLAVLFVANIVVRIISTIRRRRARAQADAQSL